MASSLIKSGKAFLGKSGGRLRKSEAALLGVEAHPAGLMDVQGNGLSLIISATKVRLWEIGSHSLHTDA